jgi:hypothetical protein
MADERVEAQVLSIPRVDSRDWYAWNDLQPPGPPRFHLTGEVLVPNPGVHPLLVRKAPQGINPTILLLDLLLKQEPGLWPQVMVWLPARYDKTPGYYRQVQIFSQGTLIADLPVQDVH